MNRKVKRIQILLYFIIAVLTLTACSSRNRAAYEDDDSYEEDPTPSSAQILKKNKKVQEVPKSIRLDDYVKQYKNGEDETNHQVEIINTKPMTVYYPEVEDYEVSSWINSTGYYFVYPRNGPWYYETFDQMPSMLKNINHTCNYGVQFVPKELTDDMKVTDGKNTYTLTKKLDDEDDINTFVDSVAEEIGGIMCDKDIENSSDLYDAGCRFDSVTIKEVFNKDDYKLKSISYTVTFDVEHRPDKEAISSSGSIEITRVKSHINGYSDLKVPDDVVDNAKKASGKSKQYIDMLAAGYATKKSDKEYDFW